MSYGIIGGADGPTAIFLAGTLDGGWINIVGLIIVVLILVPNIIYMLKFRNMENHCKNKMMNILEQSGRYASMVLMIFDIGIVEFGFASLETFLIYILGNSILLLAYWIIWGMYFIKVTRWKSMTLAIIPTAIFLISGITLSHILLVISSAIFGVGHLYITYKNAEYEMKKGEKI